MRVILYCIVSYTTVGWVCEIQYTMNQVKVKVKVNRAPMEIHLIYMFVVKYL